MARYSTIGNKFKNICISGLNRVEYFSDAADESIFADTWQDATDEQSRKNLALVFFAPRDLEGDPADPLSILTDQSMSMDLDDNMEDDQQTLAGIPLLDMCRIKSASANTVNILVAADVIFHWDVNDSYIQPTSPMTWARDLKMVIKGYPASTEKHVYTAWEASKISELNVELHPIQDLPLDPNTWINTPTFQDKYGTLMLVFSIILALFVYGIHYTQNSRAESISDEIRSIIAATPSGSDFESLARTIREQQRYMHYKHLMPIITKDVASAVQNAGLKMSSFEIETTTPKQPPENLIVRIKGKTGEHQGWLQEENIAKAVLAQSTTLSAIRKPPGGKKLVLEGIVELAPIKIMVDDYEKKAAILQGKIAPNTSSTAGGSRS